MLSLLALVRTPCNDRLTTIDFKSRNGWHGIRLSDIAGATHALSQLSIVRGWWVRSCCHSSYVIVVTATAMRVLAMDKRQIGEHI